MNPILLEMMARERHEEMMREAERLRLVAQYEANRPSLRESLLTALGNTLIRGGEWLRNRYCRKCEVQPQLCGK